MDGIKEHLLQGEWCAQPPVGYDIVKHNRERKIVINDTGQIIKKCFSGKPRNAYRMGKYKSGSKVMG